MVVTAGIFLPAFAFTMLGHATFERLFDNRAVHAFLDGVTAAVVGLIAATALGLARVAIAGPFAAAVFAVALVTLAAWGSRAATAVVVLAAGVAGLLA